VEHPHVPLEDCTYHKERPWPVAPLGPKTAIVPPRIVHDQRNIQRTHHAQIQHTYHLLYVEAYLEAQTHHTLASHHQPRLKHTTRRAVPVLVGQLSSQSLLTLPPEAELGGPTTSVGTRTDYSVGPWDYPTCAAQHLLA
jgi:hypothetical protein